MAELDHESRYTPLEVPEFKSTIPAHLLGKLTEQERYLVETLSKMEQQNTWLIKAVVEGNRANIEEDKRLLKVERWKQNITSKWAIIAGLFLILFPLFARELISKWLNP